MLAGSELSLIPFEMAIAPLAYPGEGLEFCLQASLPTVVTREIRGQQVPFRWNRSSKELPKILMIFAEPAGMRVPAKEHIQTIRAALEPWIRHIPEHKRTANEEENNRLRLEFVKNRLRILPNASIQSIYEMCSKEKFTHIHILAHGDTYKQAGETRFGVALCKDGSNQKEVVSGKRLAKVLQAEGALGSDRSEPLVVTLATCDSGSQTSVLVPGGSIAHDLHVEGIPWVFASQFPLTVLGSVTMTKMLYPRLLRGDDPRQILFELRRQLYHSTQTDHDWASIVAYAALGRDFSTQVAQFSSAQIKTAINVCLEHADSMVANQAQKADEEYLNNVIDEVKEWLRMWQGRKPTGNSAEERLRRADIVGMHGSTYKRIALLLFKAKGDQETDEVKKYYRKSLGYYREAMGEAAATGMTYYWTATQYLSLQAILSKHEIVRGLQPDKQTFELARSLAKRDIDSNESNSTKAWAHGTLAEARAAQHVP